MKERPILFSSPMVRAILEGRKTMTRRVVKEPVLDHLRQGLTLDDEYENGNTGETMPLRTLCPYGQPGDRLWVRETFALESSGEYSMDEALRCHPEKPVPFKEETDDAFWQVPHYRATEPDCTLVSDDNEGEDDTMRLWKPSIHMPRWASRITLEVTGVRVERLQDISEEDARAEGVDPMEREYLGIPAKGYREGFIELWDSLNAARGHGWDKNDWVWVINLRRVKS